MSVGVKRNQHYLTNTLQKKKDNELATIKIES